MVNETSFEGLVAASAHRRLHRPAADRRQAMRLHDRPAWATGGRGVVVALVRAAVGLICRQLCPLFVDSRTYREPVDTACGSAGSVRSWRARWARHLSAPAGDVW